MSVLAPSRTLDQRMLALEKANAIRIARAALKRNLANGTADILLVLTDPAPELLTMKVYDLLCALPGWGPQTARRTLNRVRVAHGKTVGGLSLRQRTELSQVVA